MANMLIREIVSDDIDAVVALWVRCRLTRPWNDPVADIALARQGRNSTILIGYQGPKIVATAMVGCDGHRGWVYYLAVEPALQRNHLGRAMMQAAEAWLVHLGAPKIQLMVRSTNAQAMGFYEQLGYFREETVVWGKRLDATPWPPAQD